MIDFEGQVALITGSGRGMNVSSSATLGIGTLAPYASAKAALIGLTAEAANRQLTPELVAEHFSAVRDLRDSKPIGSSREENERYMRWLPWTGGRTGTF
jgi:hypothetical protein